MEQARQQALEMKDELVQGFQEIRNNFPANFPANFPKPKHVKQPNGCYKIIHKSTTSSWRTDRYGEEWLQKTNAFFDHLVNNLEDTNTSFDEICDEIYIILRTVDKDQNPATIDIATCSKDAFIISVIRECLKENNLPLQYSNGWKEFAKRTSKYVTSASSPN